MAAFWWTPAGSRTPTPPWKGASCTIWMWFWLYQARLYAYTWKSLVQVVFTSCLLYRAVGAVNVSIHKILRFRDGINTKVRQARRLECKISGDSRGRAYFCKFTSAVPPCTPSESWPYSERWDALLKVTELARSCFAFIPNSTDSCLFHYIHLQILKSSI